MQNVITSLLLLLNKQSTEQNPRDLLKQCVLCLHEHLNTIIAIGYELVPETGMPLTSPIVFGEHANNQVLQHPSQDSLLLKHIRRWELRIENCDVVLGTPHVDKLSVVDYQHFLVLAGIRSYVFLPIDHHGERLGIILLHYRDFRSLNEDEHYLLTACGVLIGNYISRSRHMEESIFRQKSRMAIAHTLYSEVAARFRGEIEYLESTTVNLLRGVGAEMSPEFISSLEAAKTIVFRVVRDLVIQTSGDVLIDLRTMSLDKALNTSAAALERAWRPEQRVTIRFAPSPIPSLIEQQSLKLRQIIYTIILEGIGNAIKYAGTPIAINVALDWHESQIHVEIIDNGKGFDTKQVRYSEHGLGFWETYIPNYLGGTFRVISAPNNQGTTVYARIPVIPLRRG